MEIQKYNYQNDVQETEIEMEINLQKNELNEQQLEIDRLNEDEENINN